MKPDGTADQPRRCTLVQTRIEFGRGRFASLFPRYSSGGGLHPGFSLGISVENPEHPVLKEELEGVAFFIEEQDTWYLQGYDLVVNYLAAYDDIEYVYEAEREHNTSATS